MAEARRAALVEDTTELLDPKRAHEAFRNRAKNRPQLQKLSDEAKNRGYRSQDTADQSIGIRMRSHASADINPTGPARGPGIRTVEFELVGQSVSKEGAEGAIATAVIKAGNNQLAYDILLEAPGGDFQHAREFTIVGDEVVPANSWWSAWRGCLTRTCASTCLTSLFTCSGTWAAYFWCVAATCGGCVLKCAGCASCDCSWWCRWAAGCCDA